MDDHLKNGGNGRDGSGQFAKGWTGGPGRPPGYRSALAKTLDEIPEQDVTAIRDKLVKLAKTGDMQAARLILDRHWPVPKGRPVAFDLPPVTSAAELPAAIGAVLAAVAKGELSPEEGIAIANIIEQHRKGLELADIEARITRLEKKGINGHAHA